MANWQETKGSCGRSSFNFETRPNVLLIYKNAGTTYFVILQSHSDGDESNPRRRKLAERIAVC